MKVIVLAFIIFLSSISLLAQSLPEWYRVYTFEDSFIDMKTSSVIFGEDATRRLIFRWNFHNPESLSAKSNLKYKSRQELFEFNCRDWKYRIHGVVLFDDYGKIIHSEKATEPNEWRNIERNGMIERLFIPACSLEEIKSIDPLQLAEEREKKKVAMFAYSFFRRLEQVKDFKPLIKEFFAPDFLDGYLKEKRKNLFLVLNDDLAEKVRRTELQRFYIALLNASYLSGEYIVAKYPSVINGDETINNINEKKVFPPDVIRLVKNHPYTAASMNDKNDYDYLGENIDSVERLRSYTDMLEKFGIALRKHVIRNNAGKPNVYLRKLSEKEIPYLFKTKKIICSKECFGLPKGTEIFEVEAYFQMFALQISEIDGEMKVLSITPSIRQ